MEREKKKRKKKQPKDLQAVHIINHFHVTFYWPFSSDTLLFIFKCEKNGNKRVKFAATNTTPRR